MKTRAARATLGLAAILPLLAFAALTARPAAAQAAPAPAAPAPGATLDIAKLPEVVAKVNGIEIKKAS